MSYEDKIDLYKQRQPHCRLLCLGEILRGTRAWDIRGWRIEWVITRVFYSPSLPKILTTEDLIDMELQWQDYLCERLEKAEANA